MSHLRPVRVSKQLMDYSSDPWEGANIWFDPTASLKHPTLCGYKVDPNLLTVVQNFNLSDITTQASPLASS